jgi:hypothetical protein
MKPSRRDCSCRLRIRGAQLRELKRFTWSMAEAFDLDHKIEAYAGTGLLTLYRWDLDCLVDVIDMALDDEEAYPTKSAPAYRAMRTLRQRIRRAHNAAFALQEP